MFSKKTADIIKRIGGRKFVSLPLGTFGTEVEITNEETIIAHPHMQRLAGVQQLANASVVYPLATHTRLAHSLDALCAIRVRIGIWQTLGMITRQEARDLELGAIIHDAGHGPESHVLDRVCSIDHDQNGLRRLDDMKEVIENCGGNFTNIRTIQERKNPLWQAIMHHPLGAEKLAYLSMDARHCLSTQPPDVAKLMEDTLWLEKQLVVRIKALNAAIDLKRFYVMMYRDVYLRKACVISQRVLEKIIFAMLAEKQFTENELWDMTDAELFARVYNCPKHINNFGRYKDRTSKCVVAFRFPGYSFTENTSGKSLAVFERDENFFKLLGDKENSSPANLAVCEEELARVLHIDVADIDIVPPMSVWRYAPPPIPVLNGAEIRLDTEILPPQEAAIRDLARMATVFRICVSRDKRDRAYEQKDKINEFFDDWMKKLKK